MEPKTIDVQFNLEDLDNLFDILDENIKTLITMGQVKSAEFEINRNLIDKVISARTRLRQQKNRRKRHENV